jgi:large subunit ribosomal protein L30
MARVAITLKRSAIGFASNQRRILESLGLRRLHHTVEHDDTPSIMGMVQKVRHLVVVEPVEPSKAD